MQRLLIFVFLLITCAAVCGQDRIQRSGGQVIVNGDGSVTVTLASGKTFKLTPQASNPVSCVEGQFNFKTGDGLYQGVGSAPCAWQKFGTGTGNVVGPASAVSGHLATYGDTSGKVLVDGGAIPSATPGGSNTQVQFNNSGAFGGVAGFTWVAPTLMLAGATTTGPDVEVKITGDTVSRVAMGINTSDVARIGFGPGSGARDAFLEYGGAGVIKQGGTDTDLAAGVIAQTTKVQSVLTGGTADQAGKAWTFIDSAGKGTGTSGGFVFQVHPAGSTGSALNAAVTAATLNSAGQLSLGWGTTTPTAGPMIAVASTISTSPRGILSAQYSADTAGARVGFQKARGTVASPTTVVTGDTLGRLMFRGYDGTSYLEMASIEAASTGTIGTSQVPTQLIFATATNANPSVLTTALTLGADQSTTLGGALKSSGGKTLAWGNTLTLNGTDSTTMTFPTTSATIARTDAANTFTGTQTFSSAPSFTGGIIITFGDMNAVNGRSIGWQGTAPKFKSPANGVITLLTSAETGFGSFILGPTSPSTIGAIPTHNQSFTILQAEELLTIGAGATTTTTMQIPANAVVMSVSTRVTTVIPVAATYTVTVGSTVCSTTAISTAANTTDPGTFSGSFFNSTTQSVTITPNTPPLAATGVVRVTVTYYVITPPTS